MSEADRHKCKPVEQRRRREWMIKSRQRQLE